MEYKPRRVSYKEWLEPNNLLKLEAWARDGLTDAQIAHNIGIARSTLYNWKYEYREIADALKKGKEVADIQVENAMYKRALGYEYEEEKIYIEDVDGKIKKKKEINKKYSHPDTTAQIFWLKNRKPLDWRDRRETELTTRGEKTVANILKGVIEDGQGKEV